eukprot:TRINITY_DN102_c0_g2_i2.p1 TRINITY_DN102_c0_g2~~TRINITY_DN102_c0_g2_i2.p1  ORF type:complete len:652 (+),score=141.22 TRINITY_DN102_c0_g2_i2:58-1956(+)
MAYPPSYGGGYSGYPPVPSASPYGGGPYDSSSPYGSSGAYGSSSGPYGASSGPYGSSSGPYGASSGPYGSSSPYGSAAYSPYGSSSAYDPFGYPTTTASPYQSSSYSYGQASSGSHPGAGHNPYGGPQGSSPSPYGSSGQQGPYGVGSNPMASGQGAYGTNPAAPGQGAYGTNPAVPGQGAYGSNPAAPGQGAYGAPVPGGSYPGAPGQGGHAYPGAPGQTSPYPGSGPAGAYTGPSPMGSAPQPGQQYPGAPQGAQAQYPGAPGTAPWQPVPTSSQPGYPLAQPQPAQPTAGFTSAPSAPVAQPAGFPPTAPVPGAPLGQPGFSAPAPFDPTRIVQQLQEVVRSKQSKGFIELVARLGPQELEAVKKGYASATGSTLIKDAEQDANFRFKDVLVGILKSREEYDSDALYQAIVGAGTDEEALIDILIGMPRSHLELVKQCYQRDHKEPLDQAVKGDTSGDFQKFMTYLLRGRDETTTVDQERARADAVKLFQAGEGKLGTDEETWYQTLTTPNWHQLRAIMRAYEASPMTSHHHLIQATESEFSGWIKTAIVAMLTFATNPGEYYARRINESIVGAGTKDQKLIRIIVGQRHRLPLIKEAYANLYHRTVYRHVENDTSGDYKELLLSIIGD